MTRTTILALIATLTACGSEVAYYSPKTVDAGSGGSDAATGGFGGQGGDGGTGGSLDAGPDAEPDACVTVPCLVPGDEWIECGCGEVCCDYGEISDCAAPDQCPDSDPTPP